MLFGALMGTSGSQPAVTWPLARRGGLRKKMVYLAVLRENYWSFSSQKVAKKKRPVLGVNIFV